MNAPVKKKGKDVKSVSDLGDLQGKRVLIRCDFNVPLDGETITDDGRIKAALPTLTKLRNDGAMECWGNSDFAEAPSLAIGSIGDAGF